MKYIYLTILLFMLVFGYFIIFQEENVSRDRRQQKAYIESRGKTKVPQKWRGAGYGEGI